MYFVISKIFPGRRTKHMNIDSYFLLFTSCIYKYNYKNKPQFYFISDSQVISGLGSESLLILMFTFNDHFVQSITTTNSYLASTMYHAHKE